MAGRPRQRNSGVWELRVCLGRDDASRVRNKYTTFEGTRRAAERELAQLVTHQEDEPARVPHEDEQAWGPTTTINDAIQGWKQNGWQDLSPDTVPGYEGVWRRSIHAAYRGLPPCPPTTSSATSATSRRAEPVDTEGYEGRAPAKFER
jgi:hypothetical protein